MAHREYTALSIEDMGRKIVKGEAFIDVRAVYDPAALQAAGLKLWRL